VKYAGEAFFVGALKRTAVINVVGLAESLVGSATPNIARFAGQGAKAGIVPAFPAVTCTAQSTYLTGTAPGRHGIVGNGWYNRQLAEVQFWKQSNHLVGGAKIWEQLRGLDASPSGIVAPSAAAQGQSPVASARFTCAQLFWWFNMYSSADYSITPRPAYPAAGGKVFDIYTWPYGIGPEIKRDLGEFPFPTFWGPAAGVHTPQGGADAASRWIAASAKWIENKYAPTLSLVYLPHLDYNLQRYGPGPTLAADLAQIDSIAGDLISFFQTRGVQVILLSEYGIVAVDTPIHLNRLFRQKGWLAVKEELGLEILDAGASKVFAVADHQVAHIYLNDRSLEGQARQVLENQGGIQSILGVNEKIAAGLDHPRAGDLIAEAKERAWFTYYYWLDDAKAPDFARCVDIHRKPGYDPVELFLDPRIPFIKLKILWRLLQKNLGYRMLMDVIPLDATLVKGSHGRRASSAEAQPLLICERPELPLPARIDSTEVCGIIKGRMVTP
jgi:predicted AlkP superfamily pyrophosphatase or phosphodiesterase